MTDETEGGRYIVLVIDDAPETLGLVSDALEGNGMTVLVARSGEEGLRLTRRVQPDVILLDWNMPVMTGIEFIVQLRQVPGGDKPKVVFCTTENDVAHIREAISAGADEYVMKPFDHETLQIKLQLVGMA